MDTAMDAADNGNAGRGRLLRALLLVALLVAIGAVRRLSYGEPVERDLATYAIVGQGMAQGRALYSDMWDHKPPAIYLTYQLFISVFGFGSAAIFALGWVAAALTLLGVYHAAAARGPVSGLVAAGLWTAVCSDIGLQANQPNTEVFINACLIWAFALQVRCLPRLPDTKRCLASGVLFGAAALYKPVALAALAGLLVWGWGARWRAGLRRVALTVGAGGLVIAGVLAVFAWGDGGALRATLLDYNRAYAGSLVANLRAALTVQHLYPAYLWGITPLVGVMLVGALAARCRASRAAWMLAGYGLGVFVAVASPGQFFPHYYQLWLPVLAVAGAWALESLAARGEPARLRLRLACGGLVLAALLLALQAPDFFLTPDEISTVKYGSDEFVRDRDVGLQAAQLLRADEAMQQLGARPSIQFAAGRMAVSGVVQVLPLFAGPLVIPLTERMLSDLRAQPPELVIVTVRIAAGHPLAVWLHTHYRPLPGNDARPYPFYCRRSGSLAQRLGLKP